MTVAFVTGGAGFLGLNLVEQLLQKGWEVIVFDLDPSRAEIFKGKDIHLVQGDITDADSCLDALPENVDAVFHLAGDTTHWKPGDERQTRINVDGTRNMVEAAFKQQARRFILTSSIGAYGIQPGRITEESLSNAESSIINYWRTKRLAELEVRRGIERGLDAVIMNPANIIGPHDHSGWSRLFFLIEKEKLPGVPSGKASFCHVQEVAGTHIAAFEKGKSGHNYLLGGSDATWLEFVQHIGKLLNRKVPGKPTPAIILKIIGQFSHWASLVTRKEPDLTPEKADLVSTELICSSEKAKNELGYMERPLEIMLTDCYHWLLKEGFPADSTPLK